MKILAVLCMATVAFATHDLGAKFRHLQYQIAPVSSYGHAHYPAPVYSAPPLLNRPNGLFGNNFLAGLKSYKQNLLGGISGHLSNSPLAHVASSASASASNGFGSLKQGLSGLVGHKQRPGFSGPAAVYGPPPATPSFPSFNGNAYEPVPASVYGTPQVSSPAHSPVSSYRPVPAPVYGPPEVSSAPVHAPIVVHKPVSAPVFAPSKVSHAPSLQVPASSSVPVSSPVYGPPEASNAAPVPAAVYGPPEASNVAPVPAAVYGPPEVTNAAPAPVPSTVYGTPSVDSFSSSSVPSSVRGSSDAQGPSPYLQLPVLPPSKFSDSQPSPSVSQYHAQVTNADYRNNHQVNTAPSYKAVPSAPTFEQGFQPTVNYQEQAPAQGTLVHKHVYVHVPPPEIQQPANYYQNQAAQVPKKHYKIVFIKAPTYENNQNYVQAAPQPEEKTLIYVLVNKNDEQQQAVLPTVPPTEPSKPEVYFIKYKSRKQGEAQEGSLPEGIEIPGLPSNSEHAHQLSGLQEEMQKAISSGTNEIIASKEQIDALIEAQAYYDTPTQEQIDAYSKAQKEAIARNRAIAQAEAQAKHEVQHVGAPSVESNVASAPYQY